MLKEKVLRATCSIETREKDEYMDIALLSLRKEVSAQVFF